MKKLFGRSTSTNNVRAVNVRLCFWCIVLCTAIVVHLLISIPKLTAPQASLFDEHYYIRTVKALLVDKEIRFGGYYSVHPPGGLSISALFVDVFGDSFLGWRLPSLISSIGILLLLPAIVYLGGASLEVGVLASVFLAFDGLFYSQSGLFMYNALNVFFLLFSLLLLRLFCRSHTALWLLILAGFFAGFAVSIRWPILFFLPLGLLMLWRHDVLLRRKLLHSAVALLSCALGYLAAFIFPLWWGSYHPSFNFLTFHYDIVAYQMSMECNHRYLSRWWQWILDLRPVWYYFKPPMGYSSPPMVQGVVALGNPVVLLAGVCSALYVFLRICIARASVPSVIVLSFVGYLCGVLPWVFISAPQYFHYYYPSLPFLAILMAYSIWSIPRRTLRGAVVIIAVVATCVWFSIYLPILRGDPIAEHQWKALMMIPSWI